MPLSRAFLPASASAFCTALSRAGRGADLVPPIGKSSLSGMYWSSFLSGILASSSGGAGSEVHRAVGGQAHFARQLEDRQLVLTAQQLEVLYGEPPRAQLEAGIGDVAAQVGAEAFHADALDSIADRTAELDVGKGDGEVHDGGLCRGVGGKLLDGEAVAMVDGEGEGAAGRIGVVDDREIGVGGCRQHFIERHVIKNSGFPGYAQKDGGGGEVEGDSGEVDGPAVADGGGCQGFRRAGRRCRRGGGR